MVPLGGFAGRPSSFHWNSLVGIKQFSFQQMNLNLSLNYIVLYKTTGVLVLDHFQHLSSSSITFSVMVGFIKAQILILCE